MDDRRGRNASPMILIMDARPLRKIEPPPYAGGRWAVVVKPEGFEPE